ncbi:hypothetical protein JOL62DRAFT_557538 [Phyllosticta paracitricarpa]|uniref:Uncharacterized protein n=1 Tax=Phyllosticta paracitricarpa TaxID=2016321 RepID=A0ABR1N3X6_9PEZI
MFLALVRLQDAAPCGAAPFALATARDTRRCMEEQMDTLQAVEVESRWWWVTMGKAADGLRAKVDSEAYGWLAGWLLFRWLCFCPAGVVQMQMLWKAFSLPAAATWATAGSGSGSGSGSGCSRNPHPLGPSIPSAKLLTEQRRRRGRQTQFDQFGTASAQASHPPLHMLTPVAGVAAGKLQEGIDGCHRLPYLQSSPTVTSPQAQPMLPLV